MHPTGPQMDVLETRDAKKRHSMRISDPSGGPLRRRIASRWKQPKSTHTSGVGDGRPIHILYYVYTYGAPGENIRKIEGLSGALKWGQNMPRQAPYVELSPDTQKELTRLARAPSTPQAVALRAQIVLAVAGGRSNQEIAATLGTTANTVTRWQYRFLMFGVDGLRNLGHGGRPRKYGPEVQQELRRLLRQPPPGAATRWTLDELSRRLGAPRSTVHEMLTAGDFHSQRKPARRQRR
jgi:transposase